MKSMVSSKVLDSLGWGAVRKLFFTASKIMLKSAGSVSGAQKHQGMERF